jgi:hypothetical protein
MRAMPPRSGRVQRTGGTSSTYRNRPPMLRGEVSPATKAKAERAAAAAGISIALLLELMVDSAPVDAEGRIIGLPDTQSLIAQRRVKPGRQPMETQEELPLKTA